MSNDEPQEGYCNAQTRGGGYCGRKVSSPDDRCYMHGGSTPTKDEDPNVGAPEGSANALTHGATADPTNLFNNLDDDEREWVDAHVQAFLDAKPDADETAVERLEVLATRMLMERRGLGQLLSDGLSRSKVVGQTEYGEPIRDDEAHYLNRVVNDHNQTIRMNLKDWGFLNDPESQKAESMRSIADILSEETEE